MNVLSKILPHRSPKVGIAFSGGAVRGYAHLGVWEVLSQRGLVPCCTAGTSAGSIMAALVAAQVPIEVIYERAGTLNWAKLSKLVSPKHLGFLSLEPLESILDDVLGGPKMFDELPLPMTCMAFDIEREEEVALNRGRVSRAVRASCSVPGVFAPVTWEGRLLVDGGVVKNLPVRVLKEMGADITIAVDLLSKRDAPYRPRTPMEVGLIAFYNMVRANQELEWADVVITPDIRNLSFNDFRNRDLLIQRGREAAERAWKEIEALL